MASPKALPGSQIAWPLGVILLLVPHVYLILAPFTKVEESFSLHAVRDILTLGVHPYDSTISRYDHVTFPGAVPRSFIPPLLLSVLSLPVVSIGALLNGAQTGLHVQSLVRSSLALWSVASLLGLSKRVANAFNRQTANLFLLLTVSQFHIMFYISRTIPNSFAFPLTTTAFCFLLPRDRQSLPARRDVMVSFALLTFAAIVMRLEIVALILPLLLTFFPVTNQRAALSLARVCILTAALSLALTVFVDSYFWNSSTLLWPEGFAARFNVLEGKASDWGTSPWHSYFSRYLPRLVPSLPLALFAILLDRRARSIGIPSLAFVALLSILKHKEWRFVMYVIPPLTVCSASAINTLGTLYSKTTKRLALLSFVGFNIAISLVSIYASVPNYPGGSALHKLTQSHVPSSLASSRSPCTQNCRVHIDTYAAMTGASRFLHEFESPKPWYMSSSGPSATPYNWTYDKNESMTEADYDNNFANFDYLVIQCPINTPLLHFKTVFNVDAFSYLRLKLPSSRSPLPVGLVLSEGVCVLERKQAN